MMASGERTVKIRFTGETKGLDRAASSAARAVRKVNDTIGSSMGDIGETVAGALKMPTVIAAVAIAAAALGSVAGAAIAAAIPLAFGGAALAVGIKAAANDPAVKAAFGEFGTKGKAVLDEFGSFFKGPLIRAAQTFGAALDQMKPTFMQIAKIVAPLVDLLAPALADMAENALPGIKAAIAASVPLFEILAKEAPKLASAFSDFLTSVTKNGPAAGTFLKDLFAFLSWAVKSAGTLIGWLANEYMRTRATIIAVVNAVKSAWNAFISFFRTIGNAIGTVIGNAIVAFNNLRSRVAGAVNGARSAVTGAVNTIIAAWNRLRSIASRAINFTVNLGGGALGAIGKLAGFRAGGGSVMAGRSYLVGEKGPEIVTMGRNGYVTPNHELGGGGPSVLELTLDLGRGIQEVISINLKEHDRGLKRRVGATA